jgi:hypothetical protein
MYCCQNCLDPFEIVWYVAFRNTGTFKSTLWENQDDCFFASALEWQECGGRADVVSGVGLRTGTASLFSDKRAETADLVVCFGAETAVAYIAVLLRPCRRLTLQGVHGSITHQVFKQSILLTSSFGIRCLF